MLGNFPNGQKCSSYFSFQKFNPMQLACLPKIFNNDCNMIVSAPTSSGKTIIFEMAIIKKIHQKPLRCLYLAPIKSLCHEKYDKWCIKFANKLRVNELTSDNTQINDNELYKKTDIMIGTPQKIDHYSRKNLSFLKELNLLLLDEIHMLNFQQRGATLQAVVSRVKSINNYVRIIAVSATIPNIYQLGQWLNVPQNSLCVFGSQYRPAKLNRVVLGFKYTNNPFTFEKILNYRLMEVIRNYSLQRGTLVFCQTQKGTQSACQQLINQIQTRQFVDDDKQLLGLIQGSKVVSNNTLQIMLPQGVAFHNASLSSKDRSIVQKLFLEGKVKVLCTTSTLSMGINLPARLVVIKSTKCYKGAGRGYQQYTQIQMDQMMGRAGRPPFDSEGTVVIMTEKQNYHKYQHPKELEPLQSQLFTHLAQHLNAEISLKSISNMKEVYSYIQSSFCYIRMQKSPNFYKVQGTVNEFLEKICLACIKKLADVNIITYCQYSNVISARPISVSISKCGIQVETMIQIIHSMREIRTQRQYLEMISKSEQVKRYRSKLDERKVLKQLNEKNKYHCKDTIGTSDKKCFVLLQSQLNGITIENWQLRKQSKQLIFFMKRLNYCIISISRQQKIFWCYFWSCKYNNYFTKNFWQYDDIKILKQINELNNNSKILLSRGINTIKKIEENISNLSSICQKNNEFTKNIKNNLWQLTQALLINYLKKQQNLEISFHYIDKFPKQLKTIIICIGDQNNHIYQIIFINNQNKECTVFFNKYQIHHLFHIGIIKEGYVGFDQYYVLNKDLTLKKQQINKVNQPKKNKNQIIDVKKRKSCEHKIKNIKTVEELERSKSSSQMLKEIKYKTKINNDYNSYQYCPIDNVQSTIKRSKQLKLPPNYTIRQPIENIVINDKNSNDDEDDFTRKKIKISKQQYKPLHTYNWKPGFRQIKQQNSKRKTLKIINQINSKSNKDLNDNNSSKILSDLKISNNDAYQYFYNMF